MSSSACLGSRFTSACTGAFTDQGAVMSAAAIPLAIAGTGYGLIGLLVIVVLVLVIWRLL